MFFPPGMPKWTKYRTEDRQDFIVSADYVVTYQLGIGAYGALLVSHRNILLISF